MNTNPEAVKLLDQVFALETALAHSATVQDPLAATDTLAKVRAALAALNTRSDPPAGPGEVRIGLDGSNPNNRRVHVNGAQWLKVYGFDPGQAEARARIVAKALAALPPVLAAGGFEDQRRLRPDGLSHPSAHQGLGLEIAIAQVEAAVPGVWWLIGKGQLSEQEPLYGAELKFGEETIGLGEGDTAAAALLAALPKEASHD